jgi:ferrous-iron efflux pump FieF
VNGNPSRSQRQVWLIKSATYASVFTALTLLLVKAWAWRQTDSVSLLSSLADSLLDVLASLLTFWAVRYSMSPADAEHRFGHGKSEGLAALLQSGIITGSGIYVCYEAVQRILRPEPITSAGLGIAVAVGAMIATLALVSWQRYVTRQTSSIAIAADAMHYKVDLLVNGSVALAIFVTAISGWPLVDPLVGLAVGVYIMRGAFMIGNQALDILLDREIPDEDRQRIRDIAFQHPQVLGFHDMRTRHGGSHYIVQFHLELDPQMSLTESHRILDAVEDRIRETYPGCEILIHPDPLGLRELRDGFEAPLQVPVSDRPEHLK